MTLTFTVNIIRHMTLTFSSDVHFHMTLTFLLWFPDTYDAVVLSGGMGEGHIPCSGLQEMARVTKPGRGQRSRSHSMQWSTGDGKAHKARYIGVRGQGHIPRSGLQEMARVTKPDRGQRSRSTGDDKAHKAR